MFRSGTRADDRERAFKPAARRAGIAPRVLADRQAAGLNGQIRAALLSEKFVIADLTHGSYGAIGSREGRGIPEEGVW